MSETDEQPVTADWLTQALRADGVLPRGSVEAVDVVWSRLAMTSLPSVTTIGSRW